MTGSDIVELPVPPVEAQAHSARLIDRIRAEMASRGNRMAFDHFMERVLYAPGLGYYSAGAGKIGMHGDFITAPEVSGLFSRCVARQCQQILQAFAGDILELGAGSGVMAADILLELKRAGCLPRRYFILELSAELRRRQQKTLRERTPELVHKVVWLDTLPGAFSGVILGNEVLDAMPVQRFRRLSDTIVSLAVAPNTDTDGFSWVTEPADYKLKAMIKTLEQHLGYQLPAGYESEWNVNLAPWMNAIGSTLRRGVLLLIDYGYERADYYHPQRDRGTLICHYRHRGHDDPFVYPGLQDISASVDFSAVADAAREVQLKLAGYTRQNFFLFGCGLETMLAQEDAKNTMRFLQLSQEVKRLTLPAEMGERFKAIAFSREFDQPLLGFSFFDDSHRL